MASLKARLDALEGATKHRLKPSIRAFVLIQLGDRTPGQQEDIDAAKRAGRPVLVIRGTMLEIDPELSVVVEAGELCGGGSPRPDMGPLLRASRWD